MTNKERTEPSIRQTHEQLLPLVKDTQAAIGAVAIRSYAALQERPAANGYPVRQADTTFLPQFVILRPYRILRAVDPPKQATFTNQQQDIQVIQAQTETYRRQAGPIRQAPISKFVTLRLRYSAEDIGEYEVDFSISTAGYSDINGSSLHTFPQGFYHPEVSYTGLSATQLKADYAKKCKEGLRVARTVALGLQQAYHINDLPAGNDSALSQVWAAWNTIESDQYRIEPRKSPEANS